jgi:hypothetical protein
MPPGAMQGGSPGGMNPMDQGGGFRPVEQGDFNSDGARFGGGPGFSGGAPGMGGSPGFSGPTGPQPNPMSLVSGIFGNNPPSSGAVPPSGGDPWNRGPVPPRGAASDSVKIFEGSSPNVARGAIPEGTPGGPNLDPYLSHLVKKVAGLKGQVEEVEEQKPSRRTGVDSGWHDASVSIPPATREVLNNSKRMIRPTAQEQFEDDFEEDSQTYVSDEQEYDRRNQAGSGRSKKISRIATSRDAANKSEGMVATVRAFKEYLIPVLMLIFLIVGGYQFMNTTAAPNKVMTNSGAPVTPQAQPGGPISIFTSPDGQLQLSLSAGNKAIYGNGKTAVEAPYVVYDGSWSNVAMQAVDSLMECQFWFNETRDVMQTENGITLYSQKSPDWAVLQKSKACMDTARMWWKARQQYPAQQKLVASTKEFIYTNPFTGETKPIPIQSVNDNLDLKGTFTTGGSLPYEKPFERGEIRAYAVRAVADNQTEKGNAFYVRAADGKGELFASSDPGAKLFWGEVKGKDESNFSKFIENRQVFRPEKPTKIWIARNQQLPIFILYHSVPIVVGTLAFLLYWRSMMVMPGQTMDNSTNKVFRTLSLIGVFFTFCSGAAQFFLWK